MGRKGAKKPTTALKDRCNQQQQNLDQFLKKPATPLIPAADIKAESELDPSINTDADHSPQKQAKVVADAVDPTQVESVKKKLLFNEPWSEEGISTVSSLECRSPRSQSVVPKSSKPGKSTKTAKSTVRSTHSLERNQPNLLTDFFPIRRSTRKCQSELEKEKNEELRETILAGKDSGLEMRQLELKGRAIFAARRFRKGDFVVEYAGELISLDRAKQREAKYAEHPEIGCYMYYFQHGTKSYCVDATAESDRLGRLVNHSTKCPNCITKVFPINDTPRLILLAGQDICVGEELLYDYGDRNRNNIEAHPWLKL